MAAKAPRTPERVLNYGTGPPDDGLEREWDVCPDCGGKRWQLVIVPDRFYCDKCCKATFGPNTEVKQPEPEQQGLFDVASEALTAEEEGPPVEADAWMADEMPDE